VQCGAETSGRFLRRGARFYSTAAKPLLDIPVYPLKGYSITVPIVTRPAPV
jgi:hypothetical protein